MEEKIKLTFLRVFDNLSKYLIYFQKNFLHTMAVLVYLPKLKRGLELAFGAYFLHEFSIKIVLYLILYQQTKFQCHNFFPSKDIKQYVLLSSYLDS